MTRGKATDPPVSLRESWVTLTPMRWVLVMGCVSLGWAQGPKTPLGKAMTPRADPDGIVAKTDAALNADPKNPDRLLEAAQARDRLWIYWESIPIYGRGMKEFPQDFRFPRFRGHRGISIRQFGRAVDDLEKARSLAPGSYDVAYHLGLALYLQGKFDKAAEEYARCLNQSGTGDSAELPGKAKRCSELNSDTESRIALTEWLYRSLKRAKKEEEAEKLLATVAEDLELKENEAYYESLLFYKGLRNEKSLLDPSRMEGNRLATLGYAVANYYLTDGNVRKACPLLRKIVEDPAWNAFGYIAAETELQRGACKEE